MPTTRHRERSEYFPGGVARWLPGGLGDAPSGYNTNEVCDDVVGNLNGTNPFFLTRHNFKSWTVTGYSVPGTDWAYNGYVRTGLPAFHAGPSTSEPTDNAALSHGLAATNPNKPFVSLPNFIWELRDIKFREIPEKLAAFSRTGYHLYRTKQIKNLQQLGSDFLSYEYGIKPFMKDLFRMMSFVNESERKFSYLKKLQASGRGQGNSAEVWENKVDNSAYFSYATGLYSEGNVVHELHTTTYRKWVSTMWTPTSDLSSFSDANLRGRANAIVSGTDLSFATLWDAMPWTWLVDWFSNVGEIYSLSRNTIPTSHAGSCIMRSVVTGIDKCFVVSGPGITSCHVAANGEQRVELKRTPYYGAVPQLEFNLPFLDGRQLSILSAIGVTRL